MTHNAHADASKLVMRLPSFLRAAVLLIFGILIALTGPMHQDVAFDALLFGGTTLTMAIVQFIGFVNPKLRPFLSQGGLAILFIDAIAAAFALAVPHSSVTLALTIALWAFITAGIAYLARNQHHHRGHADAIWQAALALLAAIGVLIAMSDQIMTIGIFGAYAVLAAVFQGISAADFGNAPEQPASVESQERATADSAPGDNA